ncbi:hypothetical protein BT96DRAFT_186332 [Gymnopus androsaceus JB14]|uniref:Uncharacterized protein n=1 Tax=Gymnopus androsaceus JB14 TaxID=1447944 RepID=A0A6A4H9P5_9AGAR|nr:hypothetical protein BT96DRAFT_186332 [Gymnopus androsaceus JB14]
MNSLMEWEEVMAEAGGCREHYGPCTARASLNRWKIGDVQRVAGVTTTGATTKMEMMASFRSARFLATDNSNSGCPCCLWTVTQLQLLPSNNASTASRWSYIIIRIYSTTEGSVSRWRAEYEHVCVSEFSAFRFADFGGIGGGGGPLRACVDARDTVSSTADTGQA